MGKKFIRGKEITHVNNSKDGKLYRIANTMEEKIRNGFVMPDYELQQKPFANFGDIILNYYNIDGHWFETTYTYENEHTEGSDTCFDIHVDTRQMNILNKDNKENGNNGVGNTIAPTGFALKFFVSKNDSMWNALQDYLSINGSYQWCEHPLSHNTNCKRHDYLLQSGSFTFSFRFNGPNIEDDYGFTPQEVITTIKKGIKPYVSFESGAPSRNIIFTKWKQWYIINHTIDNVCVKHGKMRYYEGKKTAWGFAFSWIKQKGKNKRHHHLGYKDKRSGNCYFGYCKNRYGYSGKNEGEIDVEKDWGVKIGGWHVAPANTNNLSLNPRAKIKKTGIICQNLVRRFTQETFETNEKIRPAYLIGAFYDAGSKQAYLCKHLYKLLYDSEEGEYTNWYKRKILRILTPEEYYAIRYYRKLKLNEKK